MISGPSTFQGSLVSLPSLFLPESAELPFSPRLLAVPARPQTLSLVSLILRVLSHSLGLPQKLQYLTSSYE